MVLTDTALTLLHEEIRKMFSYQHPRNTHTHSRRGIFMDWYSVIKDYKGKMLLPKAVTTSQISSWPSLGCLGLISLKMCFLFPPPPFLLPLLEAELCCKVFSFPLWQGHFCPPLYQCTSFTGRSFPESLAEKEALSFLIHGERSPSNVQTQWAGRATSDLGAPACTIVKILAPSPSWKAERKRKQNISQIPQKAK